MNKDETRTLSVLKVLSDANDWLTLSEIAKKTNIYFYKAEELLESLRERKLVELDVKNKFKFYKMTFEGDKEMADLLFRSEKEGMEDENGV